MDLGMCCALNHVGIARDCTVDAKVLGKTLRHAYDGDIIIARDGRRHVYHNPSNPRPGFMEIQTIREI